MKAKTTGVYVIAIEGVEHAHIHDPTNVVEMCREILSESCPSSDFKLSVVSTLEELEKLIVEPPENIIVVNGHGETLPIPERWAKNWEEYLQVVANNISNKGWIFVSVTGVPLYRMASGEKGSRIGLDGVNTVLKISGGSIIAWIQTYLRISDLGRTLSTIYGANDIPEIIMCSRSFLFTDLVPSRSFYSAGNVHGVCSFSLGKGFLVVCGLMSGGLGWIPSKGKIKPAYPSRIYDRLIAKISCIFSLEIRRSFLTAQNLFQKSKNNEDKFRESVVVPLLRLKGFDHVVDLHRTGKSMEQGKDVVAFTRDPFGKEVIYGFQIKAKDVRVRDVKDICDQMFRGFVVPFPDTYFQRDIWAHYMYVVTSGDFTGPAKEAIVKGATSGSLGGQFKEYIRFLDGGDVLGELQKSGF